jgi:predicted RecB family endonuclease
MSTATARKLNDGAVYQEIATVARVDGLRRSVVVRAGELDYPAVRAASCLLDPREGDRVLVAVEAQGKAYVLAVLERAEADTPTAIEVTGDLTLTSREGRVSIGGSAGVDLVSGSDLALAAAELSLRASTATLVVDALRVLGKSARAEIDRITVAATSVDSVLERLSQRVKRAYRFVEEREQVRAGSLDLAATHAVTITADNAVVTAKELVKVDGGQIQLG